VETPTQFYKVQDMVLLPELNPRAGLCEETIIRYMESFDALPPVSIQEGTGLLVDGFHRVEAATRLGIEMIPVRMLDIPDEELPLYAGLGNCSHGRALSRTERNRFVVRVVEEFGWPAEKVARVVGVSVSSVNLAVREHRYNQELSVRLGQEVQVINSSHVQALYRVGDEQRARLLDAVATKTDAEGQPQPLTGAELKCLVDLMEDPATPSAELRRLLEDPLARPEPPARRRPAPTTGPNAPASEAREVERHGPLYDGGADGAADDPLRAELLRRAFTPADEDEGVGAPRRGEQPRRSSEPWLEEADADWGRSGRDGYGSTEHYPAPLGLDRAGAGGSSPEPAAPAAVAVLEPAEEERRPVDALREAERILCALCTSLEDGEAWEQARAARDLVREALELLPN